jgi:putative endonuclease
LESCEQDWWIYLIRCNDNSLYTGIARDVEKRFAQHQQDPKKAAKFFSGKRPLRLVARKKIGSRGLALKVEHRIKKLTKSSKEELVKDSGLIDDIIEKIMSG